jgi:hypothetical protein
MGFQQQQQKKWKPKCLIPRKEQFGKNILREAKAKSREVLPMTMTMMMI